RIGEDRGGSLIGPRAFFNRLVAVLLRRAQSAGQLLDLCRADLPRGNRAADSARREERDGNQESDADLHATHLPNVAMQIRQTMPVTRRTLRSSVTAALPQPCARGAP